MEVSGQPHTPAALPQRTSPWYLLDRRPGGPRNLSGRSGEEKNFQPLTGLEPPNIQPIAQCCTIELLQTVIKQMLSVAPGETL
jgi:hypothetical protein